MILLPGEVQEKLHHLIPGHRVQAAGGLVQQEQLGLVRHCHRNAQLHLHAPGKILEFFVPGQAKGFHQIGIISPVPPGENPGHDLSHLPCVQALRQANGVHHHADVFLGQPEVVPVVLAQNGDGAAVPAKHIQNQLDGGGLSRSVFPDQPQNAAAGQGQIQIVQTEARIGFGETANFQCIHSCSSIQSSIISRSCARLRWQEAARRTICSMCSSIFFRFSSRSSSTFFAAT